MPAFRNIRRSRRISRQPPRDPNTDEYDLHDLQLMYPDSESESSPATTPGDDAPYSPADDAGEPEVDPDSPPPSSLPARSFPTQRSSHSRKRDPNYIPRPANAFMIFRSEFWIEEKSKDAAERDHRQISRLAGLHWNKMTPAQRAPYHAKAEEAKRLHALAYPNYKYTPVYRKDRGVKRKAKPEHFDQIHQQVARLPRRGYTADDLRKELTEHAVAEDDDYSSDDSDEYVEGSRRKRARKSSAKKVAAAAPRSRHHRLAKADVKYEENDRQRSVAFPALPEPLPVKCEPSPVPQARNIQQSTSSALYDVPPPSSEPGCDEFVPTADIPEFSLGEPAYGCEIQFTDPFASDFSRSPETPFSVHDPLSPASGCLSLSDDFLDFATDDNAQKLSSPDDVFIGIYHDDQTRPLINPLETYVSDYGFESANAFYPYDHQVSADSEFSDWMRYDNCAEPSY